MTFEIFLSVSACEKIGFRIWQNQKVNRIGGGKAKNKGFCNMYCMVWEYWRFIDLYRKNIFNLQYCEGSFQCGMRNWNVWWSANGKCYVSRLGNIEVLRAMNLMRIYISLGNLIFDNLKLPLLCQHKILIKILYNPDFFITFMNF